MSENRVIDAVATREDETVEARIRPQKLDEYVGQRAVREQMAIYIEAARRRGEEAPQADGEVEAHARAAEKVGDGAPRKTVRHRREVRVEHGEENASARAHGGLAEAELGQVHRQEGDGEDAGDAHGDAEGRRVRAGSPQRLAADDEPEAEAGVKEEGREDEESLDDPEERDARERTHGALEGIVAVEGPQVGDDVDDEKRAQREDAGEREGAAKERGASLSKISIGHARATDGSA